MTTTARTGRVAAVVRRPRDVLLLVGGSALLVLASLPVLPGTVSAAETAVFRALNATTVLPFVLVWPVMQLGNVLVVPCAAAVAAAFRRWRLAAGLLLAGAGVYLLAKVVKGEVPRGRPDGLLTDVVIRGTAALGRGYVSGHAAVVTSLLVVAWPWLGRPARIGCTVLVVAVCLARVHVGAHLPLDVVGGAALGVAVAGAVRLLLGHPR
ncbi:Serine/threonine protein kinase (fragment) [Modestobacter italicus]|uniref:Serine/threonine protein kinase n=1 Tax=Modestobacter italicus (strain DSM 44449 / CECT 9708 / BC 501) TaxID=2732864 RepID=I4EWH6_MODI5